MLTGEDITMSALNFKVNCGPLFDPAPTWSLDDGNRFCQSQTETLQKKYNMFVNKANRIARK